MQSENGDEESDKECAGQWGDACCVWRSWRSSSSPLSTLSSSLSSPSTHHDHPANIVTSRNSSNACSPQELWLRHHRRLHQSAQVIRSDAPMDVVMMMFIIMMMMMMMMTTRAKTMMMNCSLPRGPSVTYRPKWEQANQTTYHRYYPIPTTG